MNWYQWIVTILYQLAKILFILSTSSSFEIGFCITIFPPDTTECVMCGSTSRYQGIGPICRHKDSWIFECENCGPLMNLYPWPNPENDFKFFQI
jgi:hypothetical protein